MAFSLESVVHSDCAVYWLAWRKYTQESVPKASVGAEPNPKFPPSGLTWRNLPPARVSNGTRVGRLETTVKSVRLSMRFQSRPKVGYSNSRFGRRTSCCDAIAELTEPCAMDKPQVLDLVRHRAPIRPWADL